jgi:hypothetical protein
MPNFTTILQLGNVDVETTNNVTSTILFRQIFMSVNPGCKYRNCTLPNGPTVSLVNLTISDSPVQPREHHWLWSVIGHPTLQVTIRG